MVNKIESSDKKFPHLGEIPPKLDYITGLNPGEVSDEHLLYLNDHLNSLQKQFPSIASEINESKEKISKILGLKHHFSGEIMKAANDADYGNELKVA